MIKIAFHDEAPEVTIRISGTIAPGDLDEAVRMNAERASPSPGEIILVEYVAESTYDPEAGGVLLFLLDEMLASDPRAMAILNPALLDVNGAPTRRLRRRGEDDPRVQFFSKRAEVDAFIESLGPATGRTRQPG